MSQADETQRDRRLLAQMIDTLPPAASPQQHREAVTSLLSLFQGIHAEAGAPLPGWLRLGMQLYPESTPNDPTRTEYDPC